MSCASQSYTSKSSAPVFTDLSAIKPIDADTQALEYVVRVMQPQLKDPDSMKLELLPDTLRARTCSTAGTNKKYRIWANAVTINAKNSYGGYTGKQTKLIYYFDGKAAAHTIVGGELQIDGEYLCPPPYRL